MTDWEDKCWGRTREIANSPSYSKHALKLVAGGYCSIHYHKERANRFIIESGAVEIVEFLGSKIDRHLLGPGDAYDVASLVLHMFIVHESGSMMEEYYPDKGGVVDIKDIVRLVEGGMVDNLTDLSSLPERLLAKINV